MATSTCYAGDTQRCTTTHVLCIVVCVAQKGSCAFFGTIVEAAGAALIQNTIMHIRTCTLTHCYAQLKWEPFLFGFTYLDSKGIRIRVCKWFCVTKVTWWLKLTFYYCKLICQAAIYTFNKSTKEYYNYWLEALSCSFFCFCFCFSSFFFVQLLYY